MQHLETGSGSFRAAGASQLCTGGEAAVSSESERRAKHSAPKHADEAVGQLLEKRRPLVLADRRHRQPVDIGRSRRLYEGNMAMRICTLNDE